MDRIIQTAEISVKRVLCIEDIQTLLDFMEVIDYGTIEELIYDLIREKAVEMGYCPECAVQKYSLYTMEINEEKTVLYCEFCGYEADIHPGNGSKESDV